MSLLKKLASVVVAASLVFGLVGSAFAAPAPDKVAEGANRLHALGIVNGSVATHPDDLQLDQQITRAQLMKIMVWAFGQKDNAAILKGAQAFPDTANHWASGEIAIAKNIIVEKNHASMGMPDGTFDPEGKVTNAQAVAFLMKFIGVNPDNSKSWPNNYLDAAVASGMLSASDVESISPIANNAATRGIVFYLADVAFSSFNMANGKTVYTTYVKPNAPVLNVEAPVANTTEKSLTISGSVGSDAVSLTVNGTAVTPAADGKFTADVALTVGPNTITVVATDVVKGSTTKTFSVARTVGAAAKIDISPATVTVAAGESVNFSATISDKDGNVIDAAQADITSDVGSFDHGKFTAGTAAKDGTITVKYGDLTPITVNVSVKAAALDKLVISPATMDLSASSSQKFTATGADAYGNAVNISNVAWSASKGVMGPDGTFGATSDATGTVTVTATAGGKSGTATINVFGAASKVQVATPSSIVANGESEVTVTATVLDGAGNVAKTYSGNVTFASSNTSVKVETATVAAVNGVATTTLKSGGSSTTTAIVSASASGLTGTTVAVTPVAQVATSVKVTASPSTLATGTQGSSTGTLTLKLQDQTGEDLLTLPTGSKQITVRLTVGDDGSVLNFGASTTKYVDVTFDALSKTATIYATPKVGAGTVTGTVTAPSGSAVTVNSVSLSTLIVGSAYQLKVDAIDSAKAGATDQLATIRVLDFNGNQLTTSAGNVGSITVKRVDADGNSTTISSTASTSNGKGSLNVNTTTAGTYTLKVSASGLVSAADVSYSVTPTDAAKLAITASPSSIQANGTSQSTLTVKVQDQFGNLVTDGSYTVTLKKTSGSATATFADTTLTTSNGVATAVITSTTNQGTDHFTVTGDKLTGNGIDVSTAIMGAPYKLGIHSGYSTVTGAAGDSVTVKVDVKDAANTLLSYDNGRTVTVTVKDGDTVVGTFTGTSSNGVASVSTNLTTADTYSFEATSDGLTKVTGGTLTVTPASATAVKVSADRSSMAASTSSQAKVTVSLVDAYGNTVTPSTDTHVYVKVTSASPTADFPAAAKVATGDNAGWVDLTITHGTSSASTVDSTSSLVGTAAAGSNIITAKSGTLTEANLTVSTVVTGTASALTVDTISDTTASNSTTPSRQSIVITLVDGAGNPITSDSTSTVTLASISGDHGTVNYYVYDLAAGAWGTASATKPSAVTLYKGKAKIGVIDTKDDSLTYNFTSSVVSGTKSVSGNFVAGDATKVVVGTSDPAFINGNGLGMTTVTATVADALDNTVTTANGTVTFAIKTGSDFATLLSESASLVNGVASVAAQSKYVTSDGQVTITAKFDLNGDGDYIDTNETVDGLAFTVDGTNPAATLTLSTEAVAGTLNTVVPPTFSASTTNSGSFPSALVSVKFDYRDDTANGTWIDLGTDSTSTSWDAAAISGFLTDGHVYVFRATVTDTVGRSAEFTKTVTVTDTTAPTANVTITKDATAGISAGDKIVVTFSEPTNGATLTDASFSIGNSHSFGTGATYVWSDNNTVLTITLGTTPTIVQNDTLAFAAAGTVKDAAAAANNFGAATFYTVPASSNF